LIGGFHYKKVCNYSFSKIGIISIHRWIVINMKTQSSSNCNNDRRNNYWNGELLLRWSLYLIPSTKKESPDGPIFGLFLYEHQMHSNGQNTHPNLSCCREVFVLSNVSMFLIASTVNLFPSKSIVCSEWIRVLNISKKCAFVWTKITQNFSFTLMLFHSQFEGVISLESDTKMHNEEFKSS
jgi:hypothetical protein